MNLLNCPLKTSHGGHLFTTTRNSGTNSTTFCCSGPGETHFVASSMVSMRFNALATDMGKDMAGFSEVLLEPVINLYLQCQVSMSVYSKQKTSQSEYIISLQDYPYLKTGISFSHGYLEDMLPANRSNEIDAIVRKESNIACIQTLPLYPIHPYFPI